MRGFSLLEVLLAVGLFAASAALFGTLTVEQTTSGLLSRERAGALRMAREGLEVSRYLKDSGWQLLPAGMHGLSFANARWDLVLAPEQRGIYTRTLEIQDIDPNRKLIRSRVTWADPRSVVSRQMLLETQLSNWKTPSTQATAVSVDLSGVSIGGTGQNEIRGIVLRNTSSQAVTLTITAWTWNNTKEMKRLRIEHEGNNQIVWDEDGPGTPEEQQPSGTILNIVDVAIPAGEAATVTQMRFSGKMAGAQLSAVFTFADGSQKTVPTFTP